MLILYVVIAVITTCNYFEKTIQVKLKKKGNMEHDTQGHDTKAPPLHSFNNPVTKGVIILIILLIVAGIGLAVIGTLTSIVSGLVLAATGAILWVLGETEHKPSNPREAGILTFWDTPITIPSHDKWKKYIVVGGTVILADYPPFYLSSIKVDIENKDKKFTFDVMSKDRIIFKANIFVTTRPNTDDLLDYIQAGNDMGKIFDQIASIVSRDTGIICRDMPAEDIFLFRDEVSAKLLKNVAGIFETRSFGVLVLKVNLEPEFPEKVVDKLRSIKSEDWERNAEKKEYETLRIAALELQKEFAKQILPSRDPKLPELTQREFDEEIKNLVASGKLQSLEKCLEIIRSQRLVKDGKVARIESGGKGGTFVLTDVKMNVGGK